MQALVKGPKQRALELTTKISNLVVIELQLSVFQFIYISMRKRDNMTLKMA